MHQRVLDYQEPCSLKWSICTVCFVSFGFLLIPVISIPKLQNNLLCNFSQLILTLAVTVTTSHRSTIFVLPTCLQFQGRHTSRIINSETFSIIRKYSCKAVSKISQPQQFTAVAYMLNLCEHECFAGYFQVFC